MHLTPQTAPSSPAATQSTAIGATLAGMRALSCFPPHWVIRRGERWLANAVTGWTVPTPYPLALNFCVKHEAEDLCERMNAIEPEASEPWQIEGLNLQALVVEQVGFDSDQLQEAA